MGSGQTCRGLGSRYVPVVGSAYLRRRKRVPAHSPERTGRCGIQGARHLPQLPNYRALEEEPRLITFDLDRRDRETDGL